MCVDSPGVTDSIYDTPFEPLMSTVVDENGDEHSIQYVDVHGNTILVASPSYRAYQVRASDLIFKKTIYWYGGNF